MKKTKVKASRSNAYQARYELLMVLTYLMKHTDEKHPTVQQNVIEHLNKHYKVAPLRQRLSEILDELFTIQKKFKGVLPFTLERVSTGEKYKYFAKGAYLPHEDIFAIVQSIQNDTYQSMEDSQALIQRLLDLTTNSYTRKSVEKELTVQSKLINKPSTKFLKRVKQFELARKSQAILKVVIPNRFTLTSEDELQKFNVSEPIYVYVYKVIDFDHIPYAILLNVETKKVSAYPIHLLSVLEEARINEGQKKLPSLNEIFENMEHDTIEDFMKEAIMPGKHGKIVDVTFSFPYNEFNHVLIAQSFLSYFKKVMPLTIVKHTFVPKPDQERPLKPNDPTIKVRLYGQVSFKVDLTTFIKWASSYDIARRIHLDDSGTVFAHLLSHFKWGMMNLGSPLIQGWKINKTDVIKKNK